MTADPMVEEARFVVTISNQRLRQEGSDGANTCAPLGFILGMACSGLYGKPDDQIDPT